MRAGCSALTFILVAAWEQSPHPGSPGNRLALRKGPLNAAQSKCDVRKTGLLPRRAERNPGDKTAPRPPKPLVMQLRRWSAPWCWWAKTGASPTQTGLLTAERNPWGQPTGPRLPHRGKTGSPTRAREILGDVYRCTVPAARGHRHRRLGHELTPLPRVGLWGRIRPAGRDGTGGDRGEDLRRRLPGSRQDTGIAAWATN